MKNSRKTIGIIGYGRFGRLLASILQTDFELVIFDAQKSALIGAKPSMSVKFVHNASEVYEHTQTVFLAVPIAEFESVVADHKQYLQGHLLLDVLSVKMHAEKVFRKYLKGTDSRAILTHPMFGPDSVRMKGLPGQPFIMSNLSATKAEYAFWKNYWKQKELSVLEMSAKEHDRLAARSQGVTHFIGRLLSEFGMKPTKIDSLGSKKLLEIMDQTCNDTWQLFLNLQNYNPFTSKMRIDIGAAYDKLYNRLLPELVNPPYITFGIQGAEGSFNEEAILLYIQNHNIAKYKIKYLYTSAKVLDNLRRGTIDMGIFAIQNSVGGIVNESVSAMADHKFDIMEELKMPIQHHLMKLPGVDFQSIHTVMAHDQVFKQCRETMARKYPKLKQMTGTGDLIDTAACAAALAKGKLPRNTAILGCKAIASVYGLEVVDSNLQDDKENVTSFLIVKRK